MLELEKLFKEKKWQNYVDLAKKVKENLMNCDDTQIKNFYSWLGHSYKELKKYPEAEEQFNLLKEKFPNDHRGYEGLVNIAQHQQDKEKILERAKIFQEKFPQMWHSYWWIGHAYKDLCEYDKSVEQFVYLKDNFPNTHYGYQGMIDIANHQNNWQDLFTFSEDYIQALPKKIDGYYHKGMALKNLKKFDEAEQFFIELAEQFPHDTQPLTGLANVYNTLRKWDKGIEVLEKALTLFPNNSWVANLLIDNYLIYNEPDKALQIFKQYFSNSTNIHHQLLLARIYQIQHGNGYYLDMLETLYKKYPDDISVAMTYANALVHFTLDEI